MCVRLGIGGVGGGIGARVQGSNKLYTLNAGFGVGGGVGGGGGGGGGAGEGDEEEEA